MVEDLIYDENDNLVFNSGLRCTVCQAYVALTEEIFYLRVTQLHAHEGRADYLDVLDWNGDFRYKPHFFCFMCWEELEEELGELYDDVPPMQDALSVVECDCCGSDIREWEVLGLLRYGELHSSRRLPTSQQYNDNASCAFENLGRDKHLCIGCLYNLDLANDFWETDLEPVPDVPVCADGLMERCWRQNCCKCDQEPEEYCDE